MRSAPRRPVASAGSGPSSGRPTPAPGPRAVPVGGAAWVRRLRPWAFPTAVAVVAVLVLGAGSGTLPLWRDEAASLAIASRSVPRILAAAGRVDVVHTAYYLLLHPLVAFGDGEAWVRLPSLLGAVAAVVLTAELARRVLGTGPAVVTAALLVANPWLASYAREARPYALAAALVAAAAFALLGGPPTRRRTVVFTTLGVLATWMHLFALLPVLGLLLAHAVATRRSGSGWMAWATATAVLVVATTPLALLAAAEARQVSWIGRPTLTDVTTLWQDATGSLGGAVVVVGAVAAVVLVWAARSCRSVTFLQPSRSGVTFLQSGGGRTGHRAVLATALTGALAGPGVLLGASWVATPRYVERYALPGLPLLALAVGAAVALLVGELRSAPRGTGVVVVLGAAALALTGAPAAVAGPADKTEDLRAAATSLAAAAQPGDCVAYDPSWARVGLTHYLRRPLTGVVLTGVVLRDVALDPGPAGQDPVGLFPAERAEADVEAQLRTCARVWVAGYPGPVGRWRPVPEVTGAALAAVADGFTAGAPADFGDFRLVLWVRSGTG